MKRKILIIIILISTTVGIFSFFKKSDSKNQFVTEKALEENLERQVSGAPKVLQQLREYNVTPESQIKLEYFFYSNNKHNAEKLTDELNNIGYSAENQISASQKNIYVITGWTKPIQMDDITVKKWAVEMCDLGYKFDCEFDGWGTNPE